MPERRFPSSEQVEAAAAAENYLEAAGLQDALRDAVRRVIRERPSDPILAVGTFLLEQRGIKVAKSPTPVPLPASPRNPARDAAASTIAGYLKCMSAKLRTSGRGEQNTELLLVHRAGGEMVIEDHGGWAQRNESMVRMLRELEASGELPDEFPPLVIQTGDRCIVRRTDSHDGVELHLWQSQPLTEELRARLPLRRVLSMCSTPKYADVPIPDWCFDAWPEAGVEQGLYDEACTALAEAGALPPTDGQLLSWCGTTHHHPSRLRLMEIVQAAPHRFAVNNVVDRTSSARGEGSGGAAHPQHRSLLEQVRACGYLLDVQGKGYSSRLKLLLHSGRAVFMASRPWKEYFADAMLPFEHFIPVRCHVHCACVRVCARERVHAPLF